jgi:hypothetical protein
LNYNVIKIAKTVRIFMEIEHIKNQLLSHHQLPLQAHTLQKLPQNLGNKIQSPASILTLFCSSRLPWMLYRALLKQWRSWYGDPMQNAGWLTSQRVSWKECKDVLGNMVCFQPPMFPSRRGVPVTGSLGGSDPVA